MHAFLVAILVAGAAIIAPTTLGQESEHVIEISPVSNLHIGQDSFEMLGFPVDMASFSTSDRTYVLAVSSLGLEIMDVTDPLAPISTAEVRVEQTGSYHWDDRRVGAFAVNGSTYALLADAKTIKIINVTSPYFPDTVASIRNGQDNTHALRHLSQERTDVILAPYQDARDLSYVWEQPTDVEIVTTPSGKVFALMTDQYDGVLVMDVTVPDMPVLAAGMRDGLGGAYALNSPMDVEAFTASGNTYALVSSLTEDSIQVLTLTGPDAPAPLSSIRSGQNEKYFLYNHVETEIFTVSNGTYALAAGLEGIQIIDVGDPAAMEPLADIESEWGVWEVEVFEAGGGTYAAASGPQGIRIIDMGDPAAPAFLAGIRVGTANAFLSNMETFKAGGGTYALLAIYADNTVQMINLTEPSAPRQMAEIRVGLGSLLQYGISVADVEIFAVSDRTYALLADAADDAVRVVNITEPSAPRHVADVLGSDFYALSEPHDIETISTHGKTYALVSSGKYGAVQVLDVTDPLKLMPVTEIWDGSGNMEIFTTYNQTYAFMVSNNAVHVINMTDPDAASTVSGARSSDRHFHHGHSMGAGIFSMSGDTYALIPESHGHRVQIVDIADAGTPEFLESAYIEPQGSYIFGSLADVETFHMYDRPYALLITNHFDSSGGSIQVADLTGLGGVMHVYTMPSGQGGLHTPTDAEIFAVSERTYALVLNHGSSSEGSVQIIDVTDPYNPVPVEPIHEGLDMLDIAGTPVDAEIFVSEGRVYALISDAESSMLQIIALTAQDAAP